MSLATTKMSSRGQIVIPEEIRLQMKLREGSRFVVLHHGDTVILKMISEPTSDEFQNMLNTARSEAKKAGLKKSDLVSTIKKVRKNP